MIEILDGAMFLKNLNELDLSGCLALPQRRVELSLVELFCVVDGWSSTVGRRRLVVDGWLSNVIDSNQYTLSLTVTDT